MQTQLVKLLQALDLLTGFLFDDGSVNLQEIIINFQSKHIEQFANASTPLDSLLKP